MNKFIEMAKNRAYHSTSELKNNADAAAYDSYGSDDDAAYHACHASYCAYFASDDHAYTYSDYDCGEIYNSEYWNKECDDEIKKYEKLTKGETK